MHEKIAYIMSRFPHLPETFILREMIALENLGWNIVLYPLVIQHQKVIHSDAGDWVKRAQNISWFSLDVIFSNIKKILKSPKKYFYVFFKMIKGNSSSLEFLIRAILIFPKAVRIAESIQRQSILHIHAHYATHPALAAWIIHEFTGISYSVTVHAHDIFVNKTMLDVKLREADSIVAISEYNRDYLIAQLGDWIDNKIKIIHCGINLDLYQPHPLLGLHVDKLEIISIGSLQPYKGQAFLIEACSILKRDGIPFRCRIIGGGERYTALKNLISTYGLEDDVNLLGPRTQEEILKILPTANCYVQPSIITSTGKMEGIPVAIMEAMACGVPVIATAISGIPELVINGETGLLISPEDADKLAVALKSIFINMDEALKRSIKARELVSNQFDLQKNTQKLSVLFHQRLEIFKK